MHGTHNIKKDRNKLKKYEQKGKYKFKEVRKCSHGLRLTTCWLCYFWY